MSVIEYLWIDGYGEFRSKTRVSPTSGCILSYQDIPNWNYDGSSTFQASSDGNTEIILKPCRLYKNPLRDNNQNINHLIVLCDTYDISNNPIETNTRFHAKSIFDKDNQLHKEPWFGLEQEYYMLTNDDYNWWIPNGKHGLQHPSKFSYRVPKGKHYCGVSLYKTERKIAEEHLNACIVAGITISGLNSEVENNQWEFQIGPCEGIQAGDDLYVARYLLDRIAEKYDYKILYHPKPDEGISGSGCHVNFSTNETRNENGIEYIYKYISKLQELHSSHKDKFGKHNEKRLTGKHETADHNVFTWGVGTRNTSIRIGNQTFIEKMGYFEDRRPGANIDPYIVTSQMFKACCID